MAQYHTAGYGTTSYDSLHQLNQDYQSVSNPSAMKSSRHEKEAYYPPIRNQTAYTTQKSYKRKWWIIGGILLLAAIGGAVGGVLGTRNKNKSIAVAQSGSSSSAGSSSGTGSSSGGGQPNSDPTSQAFAMPALDARGNPIYTGTGTPANPSQASSLAVDCGSDPWAAPTSNPLNNLQVRPGHPRLIAPGYKWACLNSLTAANGYLRAWNNTIMNNATMYYNLPVATYVYDGGPAGSGVLDIARGTQLRVKHWAYAYRLTNDTKWVERTWTELYAMSGNQTTSSAAHVGTAGDYWNSLHFLDVAEFTCAYALAYDWMFDAWTPQRKSALMGSIIGLGLVKGLTQYSTNAFWLKAKGNWNCVCNNGLTMGALAIWDEDSSGISRQIIQQTVPNANANCAFGVGSDGTWQETNDYWYFGITGHATLSSTLVVATGSDQGMLTNNPAFNNTGLFHMYGSGFVEKFNWGDCGPNKFTATANAMLYYGNYFKQPLYSLYQRDRLDAPEPFSMMWYDPSATGDWWNNMPLDRNFNNVTTAWASMRSSWTDPNALYAAIKAGSPLNKQTHSNLDAGDFVIEALGQRWAGDLCQGQYLNPGYFTSDAQTGQRWLYYRCATEGQNTITYGQKNQLVTAMPPTTYGSTNEGQTALSYQAPSSSAAYFVADLSTAYTGVTISRGLRLINGRTQVLLRDEITGGNAAAQWRMHTNASIALSSDKKSAKLSLGSQNMNVILRSPTTATFGTAQPVSTPAVTLPTGGVDLPNNGVTVLTINVAAGSNTIEVLFNPSWNSTFTAASPPSVALASWSTTSHS